MFALTNVVVSLRKEYVALLKAEQEDVPGVNNSVRVKVKFSKDFGYLSIDGYTLTSPPEAFVRLKQVRPLRLSIAFSKDKSGNFNARVSSSEKDVNVSIDLAGVDDRQFRKRWYEKVEIDGEFIVGQESFLIGTGLSVELGKMRFGPRVYALVDRDVNVAYGFSLGWKPFNRN